MFLVINGVDILFLIIAWICIKLRKSWYCSYLLAPFFLIYAALVTSTYKDLLPDNLKRYPKEELNFCLVTRFVLINATPLADYQHIVFMMFPILIISGLIQFRVEAATYTLAYSNLPSSITENMKNP